MPYHNYTVYLFNLKKYFYLLEEKETYSTYEERLESEKYRSPKNVYKLLSYMLRRVVLSKTLKCDPLDIKYKYNMFKKPYDIDDRIFFNVSHTENWFVMGLSQENEIGVDAESVKYIPKMNSFMDSICTLKEKKYIQHYQGKEKEQLLITLWSLKESYIKAHVREIQLNFKDIEYTIINDHAPPKGLPPIIWHEKSKLTNRIVSNFFTYQDDISFVVSVSVNLPEDSLEKDIAIMLHKEVNPSLSSIINIPNNNNSKNHKRGNNDRI